MQPSMEQGSYMGVSAKNKRWGMIFLVGPYIVLVLNLLAWSISNFVISSGTAITSSMTTSPDGMMVLSPPSTVTTAAHVLNIAMGFLGVIAFLGMLIGVPVSCLFFSRREPMQGSFDPRSGKGDASIVPEEIKTWSWGGFALGLVWGLYHQVWISLLLLVPFANFIVLIYLGMKGKELAWRKNVWVSLEAFKASQKKWDTVGVVLFVLGLVLMILPFVLR